MLRVNATIKKVIVVLVCGTDSSQDLPSVIERYEKQCCSVGVSPGQLCTVWRAR